MWLFSRKKRYDVDVGKEKSYTFEGREVIISNKSKIKATSSLVKSILIACQINAFAKKFPKITFLIGSYGEGNIYGYKGAWISSDEIEKGQITIHLNIDWILKQILKKKINIAVLVAHELTHIWHDYTSKTLQSYVKIFRRTAEVMEKQFSSMEKEKSDLKNIRTSLLRFFHALLIEGLAVFCSVYLLKKFLFNEKKFQVTYQIAEKHVRIFRKKFGVCFLAEKFDQQKMEQLLGTSKKTVEYIGHHMVYTLLYVDHNMTIEKLAKINPYKFIKEYETAMKIKGLRPVVSLTSGDGILDYNRMVAEWWAVVKRKKS